MPIVEQTGRPRWATKPLPDQKTVREWFDYDPETGVLSWRKSPAQAVRAGREASCIQNHQNGKAYHCVRLKGYGRLFVHRVIWVWMTGHDPITLEVDHEDGNGLNNQWSNLRLVSGGVEQHRNMRLMRSNTSGCVGVSFRKRVKKYRAQIKVYRKTLHLGYFTHFEDAVAARNAASKKYGFHANHGERRAL